MSQKRKDVAEGELRPLCKYGKDCYRKNPDHLKTFSHPQDEPPPKKQKIDAEKILAGTSASQGTLSVPETPSCSSNEGKCVGFLVTKVRGISPEFNNAGIAVGIKDILSPAMGDLQASAQFNYMFDIPWLIDQYPKDKRSKPLLIVHGDQRERKALLHNEAEPFQNVTLFQARLEAFGTHHRFGCPLNPFTPKFKNKMMLLLYSTGMRVVITTANLISKDWDQKTQGVWISPMFPKMSDGPADSVQETMNFKQDLQEYLSAYGGSTLNEWRQRIQEHDMSSVKARLVASVPGRHVGPSKSKWGHTKLRQVLQKHGPSANDVTSSWPVIGQFSSIGSLGNSKDRWLCGEWLQSLSAGCGIGVTSQPPLHLVFPSVDNVRCSLEGYPAGASIPYGIKTAVKQPYLTDFFCVWKSAALGRSRAAPHIKSYTRAAPDASRVAWLLVTSANLSKAAWGALEKNGQQLMIRSYEIGVLLLPKDQKSGEKFFHVKGSDRSSASPALAVQLPFDVPVTPYTKQDKPWMWDVQHKEKPDSHGQVWCPP